MPNPVLVFIRNDKWNFGAHERVGLSLEGSIEGLVDGGMYALVLLKDEDLLTGFRVSYASTEPVFGLEHDNRPVKGDKLTNLVKSITSYKRADSFNHEDNDRYWEILRFLSNHLNNEEARDFSLQIRKSIMESGGIRLSLSDEIELALRQQILRLTTTDIAAGRLNG